MTGAPRFARRDADGFEADVSVDIAVISDFPQVLRYQLETPDGTVIDAATAGAEPNVDLRIGKRVAFFRGRWDAISERPKSA